MNPPLYPPGTIVYWPRTDSIVVVQVVGVQCYPANRVPISAPSSTLCFVKMDVPYNLYALSDGTTWAEESRLYPSWEAAAATLPWAKPN